jgi:hypothetical protein
LFGYVRPFKPELRIKEYETYKAIYCGLCSKLGKLYSPFSKLVLSYDFTFVVMLALSLDGGCPVYKDKRCWLNPLKKCMRVQSDEALAFACHLQMLMLYHKVRDDVADGHGFSKLKAWFAYPFARLAYKKAKRMLPGLDAGMTAMMAEQSKLEKERCSDLDRAAHPSAQMLGEALAALSQDTTKKRILDRIGYCVGRWVYIIDALDDYDKDRKSSSYNPLIESYGSDKEAATQAAVYALNMSAAQAQAAFELLEPVRYRELLENLFYLGLGNMQRLVLTGKHPNTSRRLQATADAKTDQKARVTQ